MRDKIAVSVETDFISVSAADDSISVETSSGVVTKYPERYGGDYTVEPSVLADVILPTADRYLEDDITVKKVENGTQIATICVLDLAEYLLLTEKRSDTLYCIRG